jgi:hypothetical protein
MAHFVLTNAKVLLGEFDISGDLNQVTITRTAKDEDDTCFGDTFHNCIQGLQMGVFAMAGFVELTDEGQEEIFFNNMNSVVDKPILVTLQTAAAFQRAKIGVIMQTQVQSGGEVGSNAPFSCSGRISNHALTDANLLRVGAITGTVNGTAYELGAVAATEKVYASLHVTSVTALTSMIIKVQSASDEAFTSPNDRITFTTVTGLTSQFATPVSGAITDTWWRVICSSFTGTSATIYAAVGIQ